MQTIHVLLQFGLSLEQLLAVEHQLRYVNGEFLVGFDLEFDFAFLALLQALVQFLNGRGTNDEFTVH